MFIIDLAWGMIQLAAFGGGVLYVYGDYKKGWLTTKRLWSKVESTTLRLTGRVENNVIRANKVLGEFGKGLDEFRRGVAALEADIKICEKQAQEQNLLASQYGGLIEIALRKRDEKSATVAAEARVQAELRAKMFSDHVTEQRAVVAIMREELLEQEVDFDVMQTKTVTIQVHSRLADTKERLYGLVSEVHVKSGLTPRAELEHMKLDAERRNIQAGVLLSMAKSRNGQQAKQLLRSAEVEKVLGEARDRLALSAGEPDTFLERQEAEEEVKVIDEKRIVLVAS